MALGTESVPADAPECDTSAEDGEPGAELPFQEKPSETTKATRTTVRLGLFVGLLIIAALAGLVGWLGFRQSQAQHDQQKRGLFLQVGRQAALNLTTINYTHVDADVQRILDSSTGGFHDDFRNRSQPFIDVVKQAQSTTEGSITEAGLESMQGDTAQVLVVVSVKMSNAGVAQEQPRAWRMRVEVQKIGDSAKVSNVQFVP